MDRVGTGTAQVESAGRTMQQIVDSVTRVDALIARISTGAQQQSESIGQINQAVEHIDQSTQQNAALVEEASAAARSMEEQATQLLQTVSAFRVDGAVAQVLRQAAQGNTPGGPAALRLV